MGGLILGPIVAGVAWVGWGAVIQPEGVTIICLPFGMLFGPVVLLEFGGDSIFFMEFIGAIVAFLGILWYKIRRKVVLIACLLAGTAMLPYLVQNHQKLTNIEARYYELCQRLSEDRYEEAYTYLSPPYHLAHSLAEFKQSRLVTLIQTGKCPLPVGYYIKLIENKAILYARGGVWLFPLQLPQGEVFNLENIEGKWYFTGEAWYYID